MTHLSEEQLILHFYGEEHSAESDSHLAACAECRENLNRLSLDLQAMNFAVPERDASYETEVWNRLRWKLGRRERRNVWIPLSAAAGLLLAAFAATQWWMVHRATPGRDTGIAQMPTTSTILTASTPQQVSEKVLVVFVNEHFDRSARLLLEVSNVAPGQNLQSERESAGELVHSNRLYRQTASRSGQQNVAAVLEELEPILVELANGTPNSGAQLKALQKRIEARGLVFKLRILASETDSDQPLPQTQI